MNEYIKYFDNLDQAEGYKIREVPFSGYVKEPHLALLSKLYGTIKLGKISYDRYIFYTTNNQEIALPKSNDFGANLVDNTYTNGRGMMVFDGNVTSIGRWAFQNCPSLTSIILPNSVTEIEDYAFQYCHLLPSITIPNSVTSIGDYAFSDCTSLASITIPNNVTSIGGYAFSYCSSLKSVTIGNSVTSIGWGAFLNCESLTSPVYNAHCFAYMPKSYFGAYVIPEGIKQIAGSAFRGCSSLTSVTIPNSVTSIGNSAFYECSSLTSVTIGNSVTNIEWGAFYGCINLKYIKYNGYREDWYKIQLGNSWNENIPCKIVQCLDGDIYLNEYFYTIGVFDDIE